MAQFVEGTKISAKIGYGIALFDCDIQPIDKDKDWGDLTNILYEIAFENKEFKVFAKERGCLIKEYKAEDQQQIWIVSASNWAETDSTAFLGRIELDKDTVDKSLQEVLKELISRTSSAFGDEIKIDDYQPEWILHLYYD